MEGEQGLRRASEGKSPAPVFGFDVQLWKFDVVREQLVKEAGGEDGVLGSGENGDSMMSDVTLGSSRNRRIGGTDPSNAWVVTSDVSREISRRRGSFTVNIGDVSVNQPAWESIETFTSPGSCCSVFKRETVQLQEERPVRNTSSVMFGKVWCPRNDAIPYRCKVFRCRKRPSLTPGGSCNRHGLGFSVEIPREHRVGMG